MKKRFLFSIVVIFLFVGGAVANNSTMQAKTLDNTSELFFVEELLSDIEASQSIEAYPDENDDDCDFVFVYVTSCGTEVVECGEYNTVYYLNDLIITWHVYDDIDCG